MAVGDGQRANVSFGSHWLWGEGIETRGLVLSCLIMQGSLARGGRKKQEKELTSLGVS